MASRTRSARSRSGKLADLVLWKPAFFGVKPELVLKGGFIAWAQMGDAERVDSRRRSRSSCGRCSARSAAPPARRRSRSSRGRRWTQRDRRSATASPSALVAVRGCRSHRQARHEAERCAAADHGRSRDLSRDGGWRGLRSCPARVLPLAQRYFLVLMSRDSEEGADGYGARRNELRSITGSSGNSSTRRFPVRRLRALGGLEAGVSGWGGRRGCGARGSSCDDSALADGPRARCRSCTAAHREPERLEELDALCDAFLTNASRTAPAARRGARCSAPCARIWPSRELTALDAARDACCAATMRRSSGAALRAPRRAVATCAADACCSSPAAACWPPRCAWASSVRIAAQRLQHECAERSGGGARRSAARLDARRSDADRADARPAAVIARSAVLTLFQS